MRKLLISVGAVLAIALALSLPLGLADVPPPDEAVTQVDQANTTVQYLFNANGTALAVFVVIERQGLVDVVGFSKNPLAVNHAQWTLTPLTRLTNAYILGAKARALESSTTANKASFHPRL